MQGMIVPGQSSIRKSGGFFRILQRGKECTIPWQSWTHTVLPSPGSPRLLQRLCSSGVAVVYSHFLPSLTLGHVRLNAKRAGMGMGTRPTQTLNLSLNPETL